jgi:spore cortex formation protein SpoVR/YcgB (stage V sporulation)
VRKVSQYFYPQKQTQVMNEGWATFWHYTILNHLYDEGKVTERFMMEFLTATPTWCSSRPTTARGTAGLTRMRWASPCSRTLSVSVSRRRKKTSTGSRISPVLTGWKRCICDARL